MGKGTVIGIKNCLIGCILYPIVVWILNALFDSIPLGAVGFVVMTGMVMTTAEEAFRAGRKTSRTAGPHAQEQTP